MHILLTNDDGILAPGLAAMYRELIRMGTVDVVAPDVVQSASAHAITVRYPLMATRVHVGGEFHGWSVEGSPADCVKLAIHALLDRRPDLLVSGINAGENVGHHVLYSGTVAAAAEGALQGVPAVAVSLEFSQELDFAKAARVALATIQTMLNNGLSPGDLVSVNIPSLQPGWPRGIRVARQSTTSLPETFEQRTDPNGRPYYWLTAKFTNWTDSDADTDLRAIREGYVAVTPLHTNLTDRPRLHHMRQWNWPSVDF